MDFKAFWRELHGQLTQWLGEGWLVDVTLVLGLTVMAVIAWRLLAKRLFHLVQKTRLSWDDVFYEALHRPVNWLITIVGLTVVADIVAGRIDSNLAEYVPVLREVLLEVVLAWACWRLIKGGERQSIAQGGDITTVQAVSKLLKASVVVVALLTIFQSIGVSISGILAFGGVGGLVVGMAAKDLLANFFGALVIYLDKPFKVGDWIRSPDREIEGTVEKIGFRVTVIRTFDKRPLYVPNSVFTQVSVENPSRMHNRRIYETIGIRYQDAAKMNAIIAAVKAMLESHEDIDAKQTLIVNFNSFGPSSLDFFIYTFTKTVNWERYHQVKQDVLLKVIATIHQHGADCAFPTRTLHIDSVPAQLCQPQS
ncbi:mechanosensitive ion channel family protein [Gallaecimonas sp. GXIMD4217]|uniref:mechanosensitive ion channel family protein n=1 Tax=Gallaecimonas sp. GXIMD4217 TaxID=3131927 RepID=UPI00311B231A